MEPIHYKILEILNQHSSQGILLSQLKEYFPDIPDRAFRQIISTNLENNVIYGTLPDNSNDFLIALSDEGKATYYENKYSNFVNKRILWLNRITSFILGVLTTATAGIITWLVTSGALSQLLRLIQTSENLP